MSETEAKQKWTSSPGWQRVPAEGCRHAAKIDCGICHAEEFERDMEKPSKLEESIKDIQLSVAGMMSAENIVYLSDQAAKYKKALEEILDKEEGGIMRAGSSFWDLQEIAEVALK